MKFGDLAAVDPGEGGVDQRPRLGRLGEDRRELVVAHLQPQQLVLERPRRDAVGDRFDQLAQAPLDRRLLVLEDAPLRLRGGAQAVELGDELIGEDLEEGRVHEAALEAVEHGRLEDVAADVR